MYVNGEQVPLPREITLYEFLEKEGYDPRKVAVGKGGRVIPRKSYATEILAEDDKLEIVWFVGGG
jgi:sulfur carrier protein